VLWIRERPLSQGDDDRSLPTRLHRQVSSQPLTCISLDSRDRSRDGGHLCLCACQVSTLSGAYGLQTTTSSPQRFKCGLSLSQVFYALALEGPDRTELSK
jgi:hypothetical protein